MAEYLGASSSPTASEVKVVIAETPEKMGEMLRKGDVDLFSETPFVAFDLMEAGLAEPLMREWKRGVAEYHSIIIVRGDDEIRSLEDLEGTKNRLRGSGSTSGYFCRAMALEAAGLTLEELDDPRSTPAGDVGRDTVLPTARSMSWPGSIAGWPTPGQSAISTGKTRKRRRTAQGRPDDHSRNATRHPFTDDGPPDTGHGHERTPGSSVWRRCTKHPKARPH